MPKMSVKQIILTKSSDCDQSFNKQSLKKLLKDIKEENQFIFSKIKKKSSYPTIRNGIIQLYINEARLIWKVQ